MPAQATHKGRQHWTRWSGRPSDIAEIVTRANDLTEGDDDNGARLSIKVVASPWESDFFSPDDLLVVEAADLQDIESVEAKIDGIGFKAGSSISLTFKRPVEWRPKDAPAPKSPGSTTPACSIAPTWKPACVLLRHPSARKNRFRITPRGAAVQAAPSLEWLRAPAGACPSCGDPESGVWVTWRRPLPSALAV